MTMTWCCYEQSLRATVWRHLALHSGAQGDMFGAGTQYEMRNDVDCGCDYIYGNSLIHGLWSA